MPELLTRHPVITLKILKDAGLRCGTGANQQILKQCPKEDFCALPTGELCIYGLHDISWMTQLSHSDLAEALTGIPTMMSGTNATLMVLVFALGLLAGMFASSKGRSSKHKRRS